MTEYTDPHEPWKRQIEGDLGLEVGLPSDVMLSVTGEHFVDFTSFGVFEDKRQGWVCDPDKAFQMLRREIVDYWDRQTPRTALPTVPNVLYWRVTPVCESMKIKTPAPWLGEDEWKTRDGYWFYARLLISNKPVLAEVA